MASTLETDFHIGNYCSGPTIDVEIVTDTNTHCRHCGGVLLNAAHPTQFADWQHAIAGDYDHRASPEPRCHYCRAEATTTDNVHPWHTSTDCSRCGGSYGFPLGD